MKITDQSNYKQILQDVKNLQEPFTDEERLEFWAEIMDGYCEHCGTETNGYVCPCRRDE